MPPPQVLWDVLSGNAICGSPCSTNFTNCVKFFNNSSDRLLTAGNYNLNMWTYDGVNNKLRPTEATLGTLKRVFKTVSIDASDTYAYCGTTTGDVLQVGWSCIIGWKDKRALRGRGTWGWGPAALWVLTVAAQLNHARACEDPTSHPHPQPPAPPTSSQALVVCGPRHSPAGWQLLTHTSTQRGRLDGFRLYGTSWRPTHVHHLALLW